MTISTDHAVSGPYAPNGVTTVFAFDFQAASAAEVGVILGNVILDPDDYVVELESDRTGAVTISPALEAGSTLYVFSEPAFEQSADFQRYGPYFPDTFNPHLDFATIRDIYLKAQVERGVRVALGQPGLTLTGADNGALVVVDGIVSVGALGDLIATDEGLWTEDSELVDNEGLWA